MDLALEGKSAIVTGASRGIGRYIALALADEGCSVAICARGSDDLEETAKHIQDRGGVVYTEAIDITESEASRQFVENAARELGGIDILVNNVGGNRRKPFEETTEADWDEILDLNFRSHLRCTRTALPHIREAGGGAVIFISSIFGREAGGPGLSIYNSTKSAIISAAKIMALELAGEGIRVNTVAPGSIRFPGGSWDRRVKEKPEEMKAFVEANLPIGRFGRAEEVADVVTFLASERASLINGACINVDGGQSRSLI